MLLEKQIQSCRFNLWRYLNKNAEQLLSTVYFAMCDGPYTYNIVYLVDIQYNFGPYSAITNICYIKLSQSRRRYGDHGSVFRLFLRDLFQRFTWKQWKKALIYSFGHRPNISTSRLSWSCRKMNETSVHLDRRCVPDRLSGRVERWA